MSFQAVILAAGKGTRMRSETIKVLHEVLGRAMIDRVIVAARGAGAEAVTVVLGHDRAQVEAALEARPDADRLRVAEQAEQLGTGHAVWCAREALSGGPDHTMILYGDVPNLSAEALASFWEAAQAHEGPLAVMTAELDDPAGYGRMVRDEAGELVGIVEHADATEAQRALSEINTGIYLVETGFLLTELEQLCAGAADNAQGEYYLTDLVARAAEANGALGWVLEDPAQIQGVNTRADLARAQAHALKRVRQRWLDAGVTMLDPSTTYIDEAVELAPDVVLWPNVHLRGDSRIARGAIIESNCVLKSSEVGPDTHLKAGCYLNQARVEGGAAIGPMAHLRPGADIGPGCKVGNFVEVKKTRLEEGAKASHLTYLGDAHVGAGANIGAGTITCNYDGDSKHQTRIGAGAFIGSNTALVAPVTIQDGAYVGAGSTITNEVPAGALGVARGRQRNIEGWVERVKNLKKGS